MSNGLISKSELSKKESNVFNFIIKENEKNLTIFTATLVKKTNNNLTFVSAYGLLNSIKHKRQR
ncbi:hypothetical protein B5M19_03560 [Mesomycoplasma hyopneumoniae]|uniref:Uncharacterized protein n=2 Tax=Mesomycoplasma hyopneumoniae (strain 168) TaxID=907287 RepID=E4QSZ4_MESH1|nr:Putative uncharacterized protein [Mesomycoplasma hyopneumoniae 168]AGM22120.1 hypothetical protein MHP168L_340 [Mesomycoplasma hyopneumoniae 168-L]MXR34275.1 hypothetical protein [Mesomycoplasma hyopneumoniae]NYN92365.1 hypothetical protein [Mesomycoplasma hyopneumoniae]OWY73629.1 hypothetical protein B5M19_03560 [Mesomycoplasma hyopneumoniae]